jgi:predicted CXXCH cytochrome family protein
MTEKVREQNDENAPKRAEVDFGAHPVATYFPAVIFVLCGLLILLGCTTEKKQKWLNFFFDGVPAPGQGTNAPAVVYDENGQPLDKTAVVHTNAPAITKIKFVAHPPYEDKNCNECHESRFSVKLKGTQRQVCFSCHDDFLEKTKVKHQPVENSECSSCHDPHGSSNPKMLVQTGRALCLQCHDAFPKTAKSKHQPVENGECASCHNPHSSNFKGLLIKPDGKLCFECHDDLQQSIAKAPFKHDPTANGECASCHAPHQSVETKLLVKDRRQLCFDCHEEKDMAAVKAHAAAPQMTCVDCHDPHAGKDRNFLKPRSVASSGHTGGAK